MDNNFFSFLVKAVLDNQSFPEISRKIKDFEKKVPDITFGAKINEKDIEALRHRVSAIQKELNNDDLTTKERSKLLTELNQKQKILNATERAYRQQSNSDFLQQKNTLSQVSKAQKDILSLKKSQNQLSKLENAETEKINKNLTAQKTLLASMKNWRSKQSDASMKKESYFDIDTDNVVTAESAYSQLFSQLSNGTISVDECRQKFKLLKDELGQFSSAGKIERNILEGINDSSYEKQMATAVASANKWTSENQRVKASISELKTAYKDLIDPQQADRRVENEERFQQALKKTLNLTSIQKAKYATDDKIASLANKYQTFYDQNTAAHKKWGAQLLKNINELSSGMKIPIDRANQLEKELQDVGNAARQAGKLGKSFIDKVRDQASKFGQWVSISSIVMQGVYAIKSGITNVEELDDTLLELSKVSDLTDTGLKKVTDRAYKLGERVGKTGTQVLNAVTEFKRAGFELETSLDMADAALTMTNVAEGINDTADAAGTLISVLKGYDMNDDEAMSIVDKINEVSNTSPIGFDEIAEGLERTAGTMAQSGTTIDETIGLLTSGFAQLRNIEKVSTSLITLSARLRGVDENGDAIDGLAAKLQDDFGKIGVAIEDTSGNLRSIYKIAQDYAKVLPSLTSKQKQYYAELAAGKRNVTTWNAITQRFQDAEKATESSIDSIGSAAIENEKYLNSISGKVSQFKSDAEQLSATLISSDLIKFFVELGSVSTNAFNAIAKGINSINSFGGILDNGIGGTLGAISGLIMNRLGIGKLYSFSGDLYCARPLKIA